jgi:hypothetical protein
MRKFHFSFKRNASNSGSNTDPEPEYTCSVGGADSSCVRVRCEACGTLFCFAHETHDCDESHKDCQFSIPFISLLYNRELDNGNFECSWGRYYERYDYTHDCWKAFDKGLQLDTSLLPYSLSTLDYPDGMYSFDYKIVDNIIQVTKVTGYYGPHGLPPYNEKTYD